MIKTATGIQRSSVVGAFNDSYLAKKNTATTENSGFMCTYKNELAIPGYINSILDFCLTTNVHEKLGLNFKDIWNMDVWMFSKIRKTLREFKPKEDAIMKDLLKETQTK